jgi:hypothetical protein
VSVTLLIDETGGVVDGGDCDGGGVDSIGLSRNRRCSALGRREGAVLGPAVAEVIGAADRPIKVSVDSPAPRVGAVPVGTSWFIEGGEAPNCGRLTEGTAPAGARGSEGGVGFLSNV